MDAKEVLKETAVLIDKVMLDILKEEKLSSGNISNNINELIENFYSVCTGGKRLRGTLVYYSYKMFGGKNIDEILKVAAGIELMHSFLLVHDDIMDRAELRHSEKTVHKVYEEMGKERYNLNDKDATHFGTSIGINIGDILDHLSIQTLLDTDFPDATKLLAIKSLNRQIKDTGYGQVVDVFGSVLPKVSEYYVMQVHYFKTGKYTYENPMRVGSILGGAGENDLKIISKYAVPAGIAYQIQDDILGMFGDEVRIGKPADTDLKEGKKTLLIIKALETGTAEQKEVITKALGNPNSTYADLEAVRRVITETGSLEYSKKMAYELILQSKKALEKHTDNNWDKEAKEFLIGIADYMIKREY